MRYNAVNNTDPTGHLTDEQILNWTDYKNIEDIPQDILDYLRGLMLGDYSYGQGDLFTVGLFDGKLAFQSWSTGSAYVLSDWMGMMNNDLSDIEGWRGTEPVYWNGDYHNGWGDITDSATSYVDKMGRAQVIAAFTMAGADAYALAGLGIGCLVGSVGSGPGCVAGATVGGSGGFLVGIATSFAWELATDDWQTLPGLNKGDTAYSYRFANGQSYTVIVHDGRVAAQRNDFIANQAELIDKTITGYINGK